MDHPHPARKEILGLLGYRRKLAHLHPGVYLSSCLDFNPQRHFWVVCQQMAHPHPAAGTFGSFANKCTTLTLQYRRYWDFGDTAENWLTLILGKPTDLSPQRLLGVLGTIKCGAPSPSPANRDYWQKMGLSPKIGSPSSLTPEKLAKTGIYRPLPRSLSGTLGYFANKWPTLNLQSGSFGLGSWIGTCHGPPGNIHPDGNQATPSPHPHLTPGVRPNSREAPPKQCALNGM